MDLLSSQSSSAFEGNLLFACPEKIGIAPSETLEVEIRALGYVNGQKATKNYEVYLLPEDSM